MAANTQLAYDALVVIATEVEKTRPPPNHQQLLIDMIQALRADMRADMQAMRTDMQAMRTDMQAMRTEMTTISANMVTLEHNITNRMDASDINVTAKLYNSRINDPQTAFYHLHNYQNQIVPGFPQNGSALRALTNCDLLGLLRAYGQPEHGEIEEKRKRFATFIGVVVQVI